MTASKSHYDAKVPGKPGRWTTSAWFKCPTCQPAPTNPTWTWPKGGPTMEVPVTVARDGEVQDGSSEFTGTCTCCGETATFTAEQVQTAIWEGGASCS